jgi:hypothetical protein
MFTSVKSTNKPPVFMVNLRSCNMHMPHVKHANQYRRTGRENQTDDIFDMMPRFKY